MDYNKLHCDWAMQHRPIRGKTVLVVGCNTGLDCKSFIDAGAKEVHGLDVDPGIGRDYQHRQVRYFRESAEKMSFNDNTYDLVFCFATMEHIPDIHAAFGEMARVTTLGGVIYSVASPLWNSRHGHHYPQYFSAFPWAHLRLDQERVEEYLTTNMIEIAPEHIDARTVARYMFDPMNFNRAASADYVKACSGLPDFDTVRNDLDLEPEGGVEEEILRECEAKGYSSSELRAVTHTYIGRKRRRGLVYRLASMLGL